LTPAVRTEDGCELWAAEVGNGEPLILCHGGPGLWDMFGDVAAALSSHIRVIRWDQRGCGRSERRGPYSMARSVADLDVVRAHFGLEQVAVLGHSAGAQLALGYALAHPDRVSQLVYVSGTGLGWQWHEPYKQNLAARLADVDSRDRTEREEAILQWSADFADQTKALRYAEQMATPWFEINFECNAAINAENRQRWREPELVAACRELTVPTLIIDGAQDIRPRWSVDSLEQALPLVRRVTLANSGHVPWLEAPDEFYAAVTAPPV
jgi:proline iminopeptidase